MSTDAETKKASRLSIRYVGVVRFVSHVLQLLPIGLHKDRSLCCVSISTMKHPQKVDSNLDLP